MARRLSSTEKSMRDRYFDELLSIFRADPKAILVSADDGGPSVWPLTEMSGQFINVGIAEEQMIGMATGLAHEGWRPWVYAIDNFVTVRALEFVKMACVMNMPITFLGSGAGCSYDIMGPTHIAIGVIAAMRAWPNLKIYSPADGATAAALASVCYEDRSPQYIRFDRHNPSDIYNEYPSFFENGISLLEKGPDCLIIATGVMTYQALKIRESLKRKGIHVGVLDLFRLKPLDATELLTHISKVPRVVTLEEDYLAGGMGSAVVELLNDRGFRTIPVLRLGFPECYIFDLGGREVIWENYGLDVKTASKKIRSWIEHHSG